MCVQVVTQACTHCNAVAQKRYARYEISKGVTAVWQLVVTAPPERGRPVAIPAQPRTHSWSGYKDGHQGGLLLAKAPVQPCKRNKHFQVAGRLPIHDINHLAHKRIEHLCRCSFMCMLDAFMASRTGCPKLWLHHFLGNVKANVGHISQQPAITQQMARLCVKQCTK